MSSGFVSSSEIEEERQQRQEEWERVRKPDDPVEAPAVPVCNLSLFEQLRNNKEAKQAEIDDAKSLRNLVRGIDEDESDFLSLVSTIKNQEERTKKEEEKSLLNEFRAARNTVIEASEPQLTLARPSVSAEPSEKKPSKQASLLSSIIKRKATPGDAVPAKVAKEGDKKKGEEKKEEAAKPAGALVGLVGYDASSDEDDD